MKMIVYADKYTILLISRLKDVQKSKTLNLFMNINLIYEQKQKVQETWVFFFF